jgi:Tol biopolymer transport system component
MTRPAIGPVVVLLGAALMSGCAGQAPAGGEGPSPGRPTPERRSEAPADRTATDEPEVAASATSVTPTSSSVTDVTDPAAPGTLPVGRLLFDSDRSGNLDIWYLEAGATEPVQVTSDPGSDRVSSWGPDGRSVIFSSDRLGGANIGNPSLRPYALFIGYLDGTDDRHLLGTRTFNSGAQYSPDGTRIVFGSDATGTMQVYLLDPDYMPNSGKDPVALTQGEHNDGPAWSPDGSRIVFTSLRDGNRELYVMDADGNNVERLTDDPAEDGAPAWSPDGSQIAFHSDRTGSRDIFVINSDGTDARQLTDDPALNGFPSWSRDGEWIAFDHQVSRDDIEIYVMRADGSELINVTNDPARDAFPSWGP